MKLFSRRIKRFNVGFRTVYFEGVRIFTFRLGWWAFQINKGQANAEFMASIKEGIEAYKEGKVTPWNDLKKKLNL